MYIRQDGITGSSFGIGVAGPTLQNDSRQPSPLGVVAAYTNLGWPQYANIRGADPQIDDDLVTRRFLMALLASPPDYPLGGLFANISSGGPYAYG